MNNYTAPLDIVQRVEADIIFAKQRLAGVNLESDEPMPFSTYIALDELKEMLLWLEYFKEYVVVGRNKVHPKKLTFEQWLLTK